ncbi:MAG: F-box protein [Holosporales bacterium]
MNTFLSTLSRRLSPLFILSLPYMALTPSWASQSVRDIESLEENPELLSHVFSYLSPLEILKGPSQVSRKWHAVSHSNTLWDQLQREQRHLDLPTKINFFTERSISILTMPSLTTISASVHCRDYVLKLSSPRLKLAGEGYTPQLLGHRCDTTEKALRKGHHPGRKDRFAFGVPMTLVNACQLEAETALCPQAILGITPPTVDLSSGQDLVTHLNNGQNYTYQDPDNGLTWTLDHGLSRPYTAGPIRSVDLEHKWAEIRHLDQDLKAVISFSYNLSGCVAVLRSHIDLFALYYRNQLTPVAQD